MLQTSALRVAAGVVYVISIVSVFKLALTWQVIDQCGKNIRIAWRYHKLKEQRMLIGEMLPGGAPTRSDALTETTGEHVASYARLQPVCRQTNGMGGWGAPRSIATYPYFPSFSSGIGAGRGQGVKEEGGDGRGGVAPVADTTQRDTNGAAGLPGRISRAGLASRGRLATCVAGQMVAS